MEFEWDPEKAASNLAKHGIDFADAVGTFFDPLALTVPDDYSAEERFVTTGLDTLNRLVVVVHILVKRSNPAYFGTHRNAPRAQTV